jgi:hypothetical protein
MLVGGARGGELRRTPFGRSSHSLGPMGQEFSGSWSVTSRHPLIHNGATNATWQVRFDPKLVPRCRSAALTAEFGRTLATILPLKLFRPPETVAGGLVAPSISARTWAAEDKIVREVSAPGP